MFEMIRTRHHSTQWVTQFSEHMPSIPEVVDSMELDTVTSFLAMKAIEEQRPVVLSMHKQ